MKKITLLLFSVLIFGTSQILAQFSPGDIAIIGVRSDNYTGSGGADAIAWVPLVDMPGSAEIFFTDAGWTSGNTFRPFEGAIKYTAPVGGLTAGTVMLLEFTNTTGAYTFSPSGGAGTYSDADDANVGTTGVLPATPGDNLFIFDGSTAAPNFIWAWKNEGPFDTDSTSNDTTALPSSLTFGSNAMTVAATSTDNNRYVGPTSGMASALAMSIANPGNWETVDLLPFTDTTNDITNGTLGSGFTVTGTAVDPTITSLDLNASEFCPGASAVITVNGDLNDADTWAFYTSSCGGSLIGTSVSGVLAFTVTSDVTIYVRGEGTAISPQPCESIDIMLDNTPPIAICQDITIQLDGTGNASITPSDIDDGSNDDCPGMLDLDLDVSDFTTADLGPNAVTLTVTDASGNAAQCMATVTVEAGFSETVFATKTDVIINDNGNGDADPGETIRYTVEITNDRSSNINNTIFDDSIDLNTTLVGVAHISPIAFDDVYSTPVDDVLNVTAGTGLLLNDSDPDNTVSNSIVAINGVGGNVGAATATSAGGSVTVQSNGSFVYTPLGGFVGTDSFTYTLSDGDPLTPDDTDTVTIDVVILPAAPPNNTPVGLRSSPGQTQLLTAENINVSLGTLEPGQKVTIVWDVMVINSIPGNPSEICNQGTVTAVPSIAITTDDPDTAAADDPTCTPLVLPPSIPTVYLNELVIDLDNVPDNPNEYIEIRGTASASLAGVYLIFVEGDPPASGTFLGAIQGVTNTAIVDLSAFSLGSNGFAVIVDASAHPYSIAPGTTIVDIPGFDVENASWTAFLIHVDNTGTAPINNQDLDVGDDGLDPLPTGWTILDGVSVLDTGVADRGYADIVFSAGANGLTEAGATFVNTAFGTDDITHVMRIGNSTGSASTDWVAFELDGTSTPPDLKVEFTTDPAYAIGSIITNHLGEMNPTSTTAGDTTPPLISSFTPADDSIDVPVDVDLLVQFNEDVQLGSTGTIVIRKSSDDSVVETFLVSSSTQLSVSGDTVTIDPSSDLDNTTAYYVTIDNGAIEDLAGNPYQGFSGTTVWNFTTVSASLPDLIVTKTNDTGDMGTVGIPFTWELTITNQGAGDAVFGMGDLVLMDVLPIGPAYGMPTLTGSSGITGAVSGEINSDLLQITTTAAGLTISPGGSLTIGFSVTPNSSGTLINPRAGGSCVVDPNNVIAEMNEVNNEGSDQVEVDPGALSITGFVLVNADTNSDIQPLMDGDVIDITSLPTMNLNIRADATPDTESVRLDLTGTQTSGRTENIDPYALFGDIGGNYNGHVFPLGPYNLEATAFSGNNMSGTAGTPAAISFEFVDQDPQCIGFDVYFVGRVDVSMCGADDGELEVGVDLAQSASLTYSWSHDGALNGPIATGLEAGTYMVTVTDGNGCMDSAEFTLEDPELPVVTLAPFPVLEETSGGYVLTEGSPAGGEYSGLTIIPAQGIFFPEQFGPGDYEITYTYTDPVTGCTNSAMGILTVVPEDIDGTFVMLDATTDTELFALTEGLQIQKSDIGNTPLGIVFNPSVPVGGGVQFNLTGPINESRAEGASPPYSVFGDIGVDIQGEPFPVGMYTLVANPNSGPTETVNFEVIDTPPCDIPDLIDPVAVCKDATVTLNAGGIALIELEDVDGGSFDNCEIISYAVSPASFDVSDIGDVQVQLTVTDGNGNSDSCFATVTVNPYVPPLAVVDFILVDADSDSELFSITEGMDIDLGVLPTSNLAIRAATEGGAESVRLELTGTQNAARTENVDPYALFGDIAGDYNGNVFDTGPYNITATPYSGNNLSGMMGIPLSVNFTFSYSNGARPNSVIYPNPASSTVTLDFDGADLKALQLHDGVGRMVRQYIGGEIKVGNQYIINISQLPDGIYYVRALDGLGNILQEPIVIEH